MLVINSIEKTRLSADSYSYSGTGVAWKARLVLFLGFALMAGGLAGSVVGTIPAEFCRLKLMNTSLGCAGSEICGSRIPIPDPVLRHRQCHHERIDHAKVCSLWYRTYLHMLTLPSSVVLWVSQNMEDDYTYNLAL